MKMSRRKVKGVAFCVLIVGLLATTGSGFYKSKEKGEPSLQVLFPLNYLKKTPLLVDSRNLNTIFEYYILENLAVGLVRDSLSTAGGYEGVLAKSWRQIDGKTWEFDLRENLAWSNGEPISGTYIAQFFEAFKNITSRHLTQLTLIDQARYDKTRHNIILTFSHETTATLLHELSLSDAVLLHRDNVNQGWEISSGPYSVAEYDPSAQRLVLKLNPGCPIVRKDSPKTVMLAWPSDKARLTDVYKDADLQPDLYYIPSYRFRASAKAAEARAPQTFEGPRNSVYFFKFNPKNKLAAEINARRAFDTLVQRALSNLKMGDGMHFDEQFIPLGFSGRLESFSAPAYSLEPLRGKDLSIVLDNAFQDAPEVFDALSEEAEKTDIHLHVTYENFTESKGDNGEFAIFNSFKGNQKDALGSWSFLYSEPSGPLAAFRSEVSDLIKAAAAAKTPPEKERILSDIHRKTLEGAYGVPFMHAAGVILASKRVELSNLNRFDLRLRFYDIVWK